jgi:hypothetical protein
LHTQLSDALEDLEEAKSQKTKFKRLIEQLEDELAGSLAEVGQLKAALMDEQTRLAQTKRSADQMQSTMDNRESFLGQQSNDESMCGAFDRLMNDIKTWSTQFVGGTTDTFKKEKFLEYQRVAPRLTELQSFAKMTANKRQKRLFVRGWAAYIMCTRLFRTLDLAPAGNSGDDVWVAKPLADSFQVLESWLWFIGQWHPHLCPSAILTI